jgi:hypothetical protein
MVCICILIALLTHNAYWLLCAPILGYGFAWIGHFVFEKNRPASFQHPWYSLLADFVLLKEMLMGKNRRL